MEFIMENGILIIAAVAVGVYAGLGLYAFFKQPKQEQIEAVKAWMLWAVNKAEEELGGGGTGPMKLRLCYDMFCTRFPWVARVVSFDTFAGWVDDSLEALESYLTTKRKLDGEIHE